MKLVTNYDVAGGRTKDAWQDIAEKALTVARVNQAVGRVRQALSAHPLERHRIDWSTQRIQAFEQRF